MSGSNASNVRLDRLLANMGYGSRREVQTLVRAGAVTLDGAVLSDAETKIEVNEALSDRLKIRGAPVDPPPGFIILLNKPLGVTCSHKDVGPLVYALLPARWRRREPMVSTVGRLDKETSGLLLLTDDGALLHRIISPRNKVTKRYRVALAAPLNGAEAEAFASGALMLEGDEKPVAPAVLEPLGEREAWLTVTEGRYHLVRRMFAALGNHVEALHRDRIGALGLPEDLEPGQFRRLTQAEIEQIFA